MRRESSGDICREREAGCFTSQKCGGKTKQEVKSLSVAVKRRKRQEGNLKKKASERKMVTEAGAETLSGQRVDATKKGERPNYEDTGKGLH